MRELHVILGHRVFLAPGKGQILFSVSVQEEKHKYKVFHSSLFHLHLIKKINKKYQLIQ